MTQKFSLAYRCTNIVLACFQNMTLGGILFGWASISGSLLISSEQEGGPGLSSEYVHMMFVTASFFSFLSPLLLGIVLDCYGPRLCSAVSIILIGIGSLLFSISEKHSLPLFLPAICLIALGGPGTQSAIIHLSNLFPNWKATTTAFITGSFQLSFVVFLVFDQLWVFQSWSYQRLFLTYCVVVGINLVVSIILWPDKPYSYEDQFIALQASDMDLLEREQELTKQPPVGPIRLPSVFVHHSDIQHGKAARNIVRPDNVQYAPIPGIHTAAPPLPAATGSSRSYSNKNNANYSDTDAIDEPFGVTTAVGQSQSLAANEPSILLKEGSLYTQVTSEEFLLLLLFFLMHSYWGNFYIGTFDMQLSDSQLLGSAVDQQNYARIFTIIITMGVIVIPLVGALMDLHGFPVTSAFSIGCGILWAALLLIRSSTALVISFVFYAAYRTSFYTFFFAYLADTLGYKYFGMLAGIIFVLGGLLGITQYPLAQLVAGTCHDDNADQDTCSHGHWAIVNLIMLVMVASTLYFTVADWRRRHAKRLGVRTFSHSVTSMQAMQLRELTPDAAAEQGTKPTYGAI